MLSLLDGPTGCDPAFCVVWFRFRLFRRYLAWWPSQVGRAYGMVLSIFTLLVLLRLALGGIFWLWLGLDPVCPCLVIWLALVNILNATILDAWRNKVAAHLCGREGFRGGPLLDVYDSLQLLNSSHVRDRDKGLLRSIMVGCVCGTIFCWVGSKGSLFHVGFVVLLTAMVTFLGGMYLSSTC